MSSPKGRSGYKQDRSDCAKRPIEKKGDHPDVKREIPRAKRDNVVAERKIKLGCKIDDLDTIKMFA